MTTACFPIFTSTKKRPRAEAVGSHKRSRLAATEGSSCGSKRSAKCPPLSQLATNNQQPKLPNPMTITDFVSGAISDVLRASDTNQKYLWPQVTCENVQVMLQLAAEQCAVLLAAKPFPSAKTSKIALLDECTSVATSVYDDEDVELEEDDEDLPTLEEDTLMQETVVVEVESCHEATSSKLDTLVDSAVIETMQEGPSPCAVVKVCESPASVTTACAVNKHPAVAHVASVPGRPRARDEPLYAEEILQHLIKSEANFQSNPLYMTDVQTDINDKMRAVLVDWLREVCDQFGFVVDTFFLTVSLVDRYLSRRTVCRSDLQLVGVAACLIAAKYEEMAPPSTDEFLYISANTYTSDELLKMERSILRVVDYQCTVPTAVSCLPLWLRMCHSSPQKTSMAHCLAEASAVSVSMLNYTPSMIASSCIHLANDLVGDVSWDHTLQECTGASLQTSESLHLCVRPCVPLCGSCVSLMG